MTVEFDSLCSNGKDYCPEINEHSQFCINVAQQKVPFSVSDFSRTADLFSYFFFCILFFPLRLRALLLSASTVTKTFPWRKMPVMMSQCTRSHLRWNLYSVFVRFLLRNLSRALAKSPDFRRPLVLAGPFLSVL